MSSPSERRQLVRPTKHVPWGIQVNSLAPLSVTEILSDVVGGAVTEGWAAVALRQGRLHAWPVRTATLSQELPVPKLGHTLYHPLLASSSPLVALSSSSASSESTTMPFVHVYAAHPDGILCMWRLSHQDKTQLLPRNPQARVRLALEEGETVTSLTASPLLVVGTSKGRLFWCTQTVLPLMLHAQPMDRPISAGGLWNRLLSAASSVPSETPIHDILPLSKDCFVSVSASGTMELWKVTTTVASSHKATFEVTPVAVLEQALQTLLNDSSIQGLTMLRATILAKENDGSTTTHGMNFIVRLVQSGEARIYWLQGTLEKSEFTLHHAIWLNRFHATDLSCVGLTTTLEHITYAAFQYDNEDTSLPVTVMALMDDSTVVNEVDLPLAHAPRLVVGTMGRDLQTHGWCAFVTNGLGLRGRWTGLQMEAVSATPMKRRGDPSSVVTLTSHLRSAFWHFYQSSTSALEAAPVIRLPPSLQKASAQDLEPAIVAVASQLQHEGDSSSSYNPMEWHISLFELLQQGGLYRSLSSEGRFALLGIGQEVAVHQKLAQQPRQHQSSLSQELRHLQPHGVAEWLQKIQCRVLSEEASSSATAKEEMDLWSQWLALALETASQYRQDRSAVLYDVSNERQPAARLWTSHPTLQDVMVRQLQFWKNLRDTDPDQLEVVVRVALVSHSETTEDDASEERYDAVKALGIPLLRRVATDGDATAFALSVQHHWYEGICQIAYDHESDKYENNPFKLEPLLQEPGGLREGRDYRTQLSFPEYVLQWHADRGLYAHVLNYGRFCPEYLSRFLENSDRLRQYRWIPAIRNHQFDAASEQLLANVADPESSLPSSRWALSLAKLSNRLVRKLTPMDSLSRRDANKRRKVIDGKLELVQAQELLIERGMPTSAQQPLLSPQKLLSATMDQLEQVHDNADESIQLCLIGLAICRSMEDDSDRSRLASQVWASSLLADMATWVDLIQAQQRLTKQQLRSAILETTVFGHLLQQYNANTTEEDNVAYDNRMENDVLERLGLDDMNIIEMKRLLRLGTHLALPTSLTGRPLLTAA